MVLAEQQLQVAHGSGSSSCCKAGGDRHTAAGDETNSGSVRSADGDRTGGGGGVGGREGTASGGPSTHLIDWEFACYGPIAYDIGSLLGNLLLSYCATYGAVTYDAAEEARDGSGSGGDEQRLRQQQTQEQEQQRRWLLQVVAEVWEGFCRGSGSTSSPTGSCSTAGGSAMVQQGGTRTGGVEQHTGPRLQETGALGARSSSGAIGGAGAEAVLSTDELWELLDDRWERECREEEQVPRSCRDAWQQGDGRLCGARAVSRCNGVGPTYTCIYAARRRPPCPLHGSRSQPSGKGATVLLCRCATNRFMSHCHPLQYPLRLMPWLASTTPLA